SNDCRRRRKESQISNSKIEQRVLSGAWLKGDIEGKGRCSVRGLCRISRETASSSVVAAEDGRTLALEQEDLTSSPPISQWASSQFWPMPISTTIGTSSGIAVFIFSSTKARTSFSS